MWASYLYHYLVGGFFFLLGLYLCHKNKWIYIQSSEDKLIYYGLIIGFSSFALIHGLWTAIL